MTAHKKIEEVEASSLATPRTAGPRQTVPCPTAPSRATSHPYIRKLERVLARMGSLYLPQDILSAVYAGEMQMFAENDSIAVSRIGIYPRARVLEVLIAVGNLDDLRVVHDKIIDFAMKEDCSVIQSYGRRGWFEDAQRRGWKVKAKNYVYHKDM